MTMSTPIHQLPKGTQPAPPLPEDSDAQAMLTELEQEVAAAKQAYAPPAQVAPPPPQIIHTAPVQAPKAAARPSMIASMWNQQYAQYATIAAALALVFFYVGLNSVYDRIPKVGSVIANYDKFVRAAMFAVVIYVLLVRLEL